MKKLPPRVIREVCLDLYSNDKFELAAIIETMYSLSFNVEMILLITRESLADEGVLNYWDPQDKAFAQIQMHEALHSKLLFLYGKKDEESLKQCMETKVLKSRVKIQGQFIFSAKSRTIYRKIRQAFEVNYKDTYQRPKQIFQINLKKIHKAKIGRKSIPLFE